MEIMEKQNTIINGRGKNIKLLSYKFIDTRKMVPEYRSIGYEIEKELRLNLRPYMKNGIKMCREYVDGIGCQMKNLIYYLR